MILYHATKVQENYFFHQFNKNGIQISTADFTLNPNELKSEKQNVNEEKSQHQMSALTFILALNL